MIKFFSGPNGYIRSRRQFIVKCQAVRKQQKELLSSSGELDTTSWKKEKLVNILNMPLAKLFL